jgi:cytoskeletal protein CcmA (bactofilin family)
MTASSFELIGHSNPLGRYPAPVIPVGLVKGRISAAFNEEGCSFSEVSNELQWTRHSGQLIGRLRDFDPNRDRLFAFDDTDVVSYSISDEPTFLTDLLRDKSLSSDNAFVRLSLAKGSGDNRAILHEMRSAVLQLARTAPTFLQAWYHSQRMSPLGSQLPDDWRTLVDLNASTIQDILIKGDLTSSEDLTIDARLEGSVYLPANTLTVGPNGVLKAKIAAKFVIVYGAVIGNVNATEKVDIRDNGSVDGDIAAPRVAIAEGAYFRGSIDMQRVSRGPVVPSEAALPTAIPATTSSRLKWLEAR